MHQRAKSGEYKYKYTSNTFQYNALRMFGTHARTDRAQTDEQAENKHYILHGVERETGDDLLKPVSAI